MPEVTTTSIAPPPPANLDAQRRQKELDKLMAQIPGVNITSAPVATAPQTLPEPVAVVPQAPPQAQAPGPPPAPATPVLTAPQTTQPQATKVDQPYDWEGEKARLEKRVRDSQAALAPALQSAALARKELQERDNVLSTLMAKIDSLDRKLTEIPASRPEPLYNPSLDPDFASMNPDVAERLTRITSGFDQKLQQVERQHREELEAMRRVEAEREENERKSRFQDFHTRWWNQFKSIHPDASDFGPGTEKGVQLYAWAQGQSPLYVRAISNPLELDASGMPIFDPSFVAKIISEFKATLMPPPPQPRAPIADLANPSFMGGGTPVQMQAQAPPDLLSESDFRNISTLIDKASRERRFEDAKRLEERYYRTIDYIQKQR